MTVRLVKVNDFAQAHTATKLWSQECKPGTVLFTHVIIGSEALPKITPSDTLSI